MGQGTVGLVSKFGRFYKAVDPGLTYVTPVVETIQVADIRLRVDDVSGQSITTRDNVSVRVDSVLYWRVVDPFQATFLIANVRLALMERTQTTLRHVLGARLLQELIENRDAIAHEIAEQIAGPAASWGVSVEGMLVKDIIFSTDLQETLSSAAKQKRIGEGKVIQAKAEVEAAKLMRQAADVLATPAAMQIRYLDTMAGMARTAGAKVIFLPGGSGSANFPDAAAAQITAEMAAPDAAGDKKSS